LIINTVEDKTKIRKTQTVKRSKTWIFPVTRTISDTTAFRVWVCS